MLKHFMHAVMMAVVLLVHPVHITQVDKVEAATTHHVVAVY